ncbi:hypothetical protein Pfo_021899 [Paulownia fortunei]|nr:hypothetical protein Pfo_021899 [Paulownia fortunei]
MDIRSVKNLHNDIVDAKNEEIRNNLAVQHPKDVLAGTTALLATTSLNSSSYDLWSLTNVPTKMDIRSVKNLHNDIVDDENEEIRNNLAIQHLKDALAGTSALLATEISELQFI